MHKYFCDSCSYKFVNKLPEKTDGIYNEIPCPNCGCWNVYPDTPEGRDHSVEDLIGYENDLLAWED